MEIYTFMNQKYEEQQRTGKSSIKFPELKVKKSQSQSSKKLNLDKYSCGHSIKEVIINTSINTLSTYDEWKESKSDLCIECWIRKNKQR